MRIEIRDLTTADLENATRMLARRHRADRTRTPALSTRFDDVGQLRPMLDEALARPAARGVLALQGGEATGFMVAGLVLPPPTNWFAAFAPVRSMQIGYAGHAAIGPDAGDVYRHMYAVLAPHWLARGAFAHAIEINAGDETALDAWFSLGFGQVFTLAVRDTGPVVADPDRIGPSVEIDQVGAEEIDVVMKLNDDLARHHNASPIFLPYLAETAPSARANQMELLADPANAHWVAYRDRIPVGMQTFHQQTFAELARPDRSIYLFQGVTDPGGRGAGVGTAILRRSMEWARDAGYERCTLHFLSANIPGARFWLGSGFTPLTHTLVRRIDERIAWANGQRRDEG